MAAGKEIKRLREKARVSAEKAALLIDVNVDRLRKWEQRDSDPKDLDKIRVESYFGVSLDKLPNLDNFKFVEKHISENPDSKDGPKDVTKKYDRFDKKMNGTPQGIPIFEDAPFTLSNVESYNDSITDKPDFWVTIPGLRKCNYGCRAVGDSMHPLIRNHALVVGEEIEDISFILFGEIYIIQTKNNIETVKYIHAHKTDKSQILLVPYNKTATTTPMAKKEILKLYRAKAVFNVL